NISLKNAALVGLTLFSSGAASASEYCKYLPEVSQNVNKGLPIQLDAWTTITVAIADTVNCRISYHTTVSVDSLVATSNKQNGTSFTRHQFVNHFKQETGIWVINNWNTNPEVKLLKEGNVELRYVYQDIDGRHMFQHSVGGKRE
ncbi:hypothetical protein BCV08_19200, partial [Vibrio breoganii]|uniref:hypothetical protein n=1 Tax=Vibrio breoganii TaxID=553239 RepID=UPI000CB764B8